jgi:hypothetical protein
MKAGDLVSYAARVGVKWRRTVGRVCHRCDATLQPWAQS